MGRSKNPEQTVEQILNISAKLFVDKGYDKTSVQDILDSLGISKGGLYHHFNSKEEILEAVLKRRSQYVSDMLNEIIKNTSAKNAKEKLEKILFHIATDKETHVLNTVVNTQMKNPQFVITELTDSVNIDAPIISKLIEAGIQDGSLSTTEPTLCAEVFLLLLNFWTNPTFFGRNFSETEKRLKYLQALMGLLGVDVLSDELLSLLRKLYQKMNAFSNQEK